jgi:hypothetical protein
VLYLTTTDKMLDNIRRRTVSGLKPILCIDTTHRLVQEGHSVFVCGTRDIGQLFHPIANGVLSNETADVQVKVLEMLMDAYLAHGSRYRLTQLDQLDGRCWFTPVLR